MQQFSLKDLNFQKLNDNPLGVKHTVMGDTEISDLDLWVDAEAWAKRTEGLAVKALISPWYLIRIQQTKEAVALLLGVNAETGEQWITSRAVAVAPDASGLITLSGSLYELGEQGIGEPGINEVLTYVWAVRGWGLGAMVADWPEVIG